MSTGKIEEFRRRLYECQVGNRLDIPLSLGNEMLAYMRDIANQIEIVKAQAEVIDCLTHEVEQLRLIFSSIRRLRDERDSLRDEQNETRGRFLAIRDIAMAAEKSLQGLE